MDANEQALLTSTINVLVASSDGAELTAALDDFGWQELLASTPEIAISTIFAALGRFNHWSASLHDVMSQRIDDLGESRDDRPTVVIPWPRHPTSGKISGGTLLAKALLVQQRPAASLIISVQSEDETYAILAVPSDALTLERHDGLDPRMRATSVAGTCDSYRVIVDGPDAAQWWSETVALARVSVCYSLIALMSRMVELAVEHAASRYQFGRPIGTFQAVRHRAADSLVACESAAAMVAEVWRSDDFAFASAVAKLITSNAVKTVSANAQQILAGIGFTAEHPFHHYMRRAVILDRLFDNSTDLAVSIGSELARRGGASRLFEL